MAAVDTFDWLKKEVWSSLSEDARRFLDGQRGYLLKIRNENERRRFVEELMVDVKGLVKKK